MSSTESPDKSHEQDNLPQNTRCRVLLVEDEEDDRMFSKHALEQSEHVQEVKCFSDGEELVQYMRGMLMSMMMTVGIMQSTV